MREVYYAHRDGLIKIGWSYSPHARAQDLKAELLVSEPGEWRDEQARHAEFGDAQVEGEWFRPVPRLLDLIAQLRRDWRCRVCLNRVGTPYAPVHKISA